MEILENTNTLISIILGALSLFSLAFRTIAWPRIKKFIAFCISIKNLPKEIRETHNLAFIAKHKSDFLLNESDLPIYECDINGACIFSNEALQNLFGLDANQMLKDGWMTALYPDDIVPTYSKWKAAVSSWVPYKARYRIINQSTNQLIDCESIAVPIKDNAGTIISYLGIVKIVP